LILSRNNFLFADRLLTANSEQETEFIFICLLNIQIYFRKEL